MNNSTDRNLKKIPVIGWRTLIKWGPAALNNPLPTSVNFATKKGDLLHLSWTKKTKLILANHPDHVQHILKTNQENYSRKKVLLGDLAQFIGNGLFASEGKLWEQQHKLLKPSLHHKLVKDYITIIHTEAERLLNDWESKAKNKMLVDIEYDINELMLRILIKTQFTSDADEDYSQILENFKILLNESSTIKRSISLTKNTIRKLFLLKPKRSKKLVKALNSIDELIFSIRKTAAKNPDSRGLALIILEDAKSEGIIPEQQVIDEIKNFLFGGFDTTASALTWALYANSKYKIQSDKLCTEIKSVLGNKPPGFEDIAQMKFTKRFIQESLRLYPPVFLLVRESLKNDNMNGFFVPEKTWIAINVYSLHRHPDFWENPQAFKPERFKPENFKGKTFAYIPFGQGKRSGIGQPLAMAELQIIIPMILQRFTLELNNLKEPIIRPDIIIKPKKPIMMKLKKIEL